MKSSLQNQLGKALLQTTPFSDRQAGHAVVNPVSEMPMVLTLDQLQPNPDNPRKGRNPRYDEIKNSTRSNTQLPLPTEISTAIVMPVRTPEMTPKLFESRQVMLPGIGALYLIGDDPLSREWLVSHAEKLNAMNAVGMVVNVGSDAALQELRQLAKGGLLSPMPGTDLANRLQLEHYPVLITEHELTQQVK